MPADTGRIGGSLLANNLTRNGIDLQFSNTGINDTTLYLGVNSKYVGINTVSPLSELYINNPSTSQGSILTTNFTVDTTASINDWTVQSNNISYPLGTIYILPSGATPKIVAAGISVNNLALYGSINTISGTGTNTDVHIQPYGTYTANSTSATNNQITFSITTNMSVGYPITFSGNTFGGIVAGTTYYILSIVDNFNITISQTLGGPVFTLTTATGLMTATVYGTVTLGYNSIIYSNLHASGNVQIDGNVTLGIASLDGVGSSIVPVPSSTFSTLGQFLTTESGIPFANLSQFNIGSPSYYWKTGYFTQTNGDYLAGSVSILGGINSISNTVIVNASATVSANNSVVLLQTRGLYIGMPIIFSGTVFGGIVAGATYYILDFLDLFTIQISQTLGGPVYPVTDATGTMTMTAGGFTDLSIQGNGTGGVNLDNIRIHQSDISNAWTAPTTDLQKSIIFSQTGSGYFVINSNNALQLPYGNNSNRILSQTGEIRLNSTYNIYEGWQPYGLHSFNQLYDTSRTTYITPELYPGASDNTIRMVAGGNLVATVDPQKLFATSLTAGNVNFSINKISAGATDVTISPTSGNLVLQGATETITLSSFNAYIPNTLNSAFTLYNTGTGYVKFDGRNGVVIPSGNTSQRSTMPENGDLRYNTDFGYGEIYSTFSGFITVTGILSISGLAPNVQVTFQFNQLSVAPATNVYYTVAGQSNTNYNGSYFAISSTTTTLTLDYPINPGIFNPASTTTLDSQGWIPVSGVNPPLTTSQVQDVMYTWSLVFDL